MPVVRLAFSPAPRYVRTARLVSVAVARRAGVADELLDEVRLAVGEACARAVARHRRHQVADLIRVVMADDGPYQVRVVDVAGGAEPAGSAPSGGADPALDGANGAETPDDVAEADRMADALLAGLVDDLEVRVSERGTEVRMVWPVRRRLSGSAP